MPLPPLNKTVIKEKAELTTFFPTGSHHYLHQRESFDLDRSSAETDFLWCSLAMKNSLS